MALAFDLCGMVRARMFPSFRSCNACRENVLFPTRRLMGRYSPVTQRL